MEREGGKIKSIRFSNGDVMKPEQIVFIPKPPGTKDISQLQANLPLFDMPIWETSGQI